MHYLVCLRLVNAFVEKTRKKEEMSIAVAAEAIGIPRTLIDIRHGIQSLLPLLFLYTCIEKYILLLTHSFNFRGITSWNSITSTSS